MRICIVQNSEGTPPGTLTEWAELRGHRWTLVRAYLGETLPPAEGDFQAWAFLGGPMNVDEVETHSWLIEEKQRLRELLRKGIPCFGICLGGQLMAQALGSRVSPNTHWEVGWHSVSWHNGREVMLFHWHQDVFTLPDGAVWLGGNKATANQAFAFGQTSIGLQFHPEATADFVRECASELPYPSGPNVQNPETLVSGLGHLSVMRTWFFTLLDAWASGDASQA